MGNSQTQFDQLRLIRSPNIGPVSYRQLMARFGGARAALEALPDLVRRGGGKQALLADEAAIAQEIEFVQAYGARHVFMDDVDYPYLLPHMDNAPPVICVKGNLALLARPAVSLVGARNASAGACQFARQLAFELGQMGFSIVSGLARGIDTATHVGSIEGGTVAGYRWRYRCGLPARKPSASGRNSRAGAFDCRTTPRHRAAGTALPLSQPHYCRRFGWHSGD